MSDDKTRAQPSPQTSFAAMRLNEPAGADSTGNRSTRDEPAWVMGGSAGDRRAVPKQVGRYRLGELIGCGGMGEVYEAMQADPLRRVAIKFMNGLHMSDEALERFRQEAQLLGRLRHPGIAQIYEADTHIADPLDGGARRIPYYVMEYIPGSRSLVEYADAEGLDTEGRVELFANVCDAVGYAHRQGVVHRDLKPGNILVDATDPGNPQPKVIDFGIARVVDLESTLKTPPTMTGQLVGTLQYMSPEQCRADPKGAPLDRRSDVYALGVMLYELLCGRPPYDLSGLSIPQAIEAVLTREPTPPSEFGRGLTQDLWTIVRKALQKEPERRYLNAEDLADDLRRWRRDEPIMARPDSIAYVVRRRVRVAAARNPLFAALTTAVVSAALVPLVSVPLLHKWTLANNMFEWMAFRLDPGPYKDGAALDHVRVISIDGPSEMNALAAKLGVAGVDAENDRRSLRRLHGLLMERLAPGGPSAVAWDLEFPGDEHEAEFCRGAEAVRAAGAPVVIVADSHERENGISTSGCVRWGPATAVIPEGRLGQWRADVAIKPRDVDPVASLALRTAATAGRPNAELSVTLDDAPSAVGVRLFERDAAGDKSPIAGAPEWSLPLASVAAVESDDLENGIREGDLVGQYFLRGLCLRETFASSTMSYTAVFDLDAAALRAAVEDRVVLIADAANPEDNYIAPDGKPLPGPYAIALAIDQLLRGVSVWTPNWVTLLVCDTVFSLVGLLLAIRTRSWKWLSVGLVGLLLASTAAALLLLPLFDLLFNPWTVCSCAAFTAVASRLVVGNDGASARRPLLSRPGTGHVRATSGAES